MTKRSLRILFAGTPDFAAMPLQALLDAGHTVEAVLTQPDRPSGRGRRLTASPVKQLAQQAGIAVLQPRSLRDEEIQAQLADRRPDIMIVVAYGLILPQAVLDIPHLGCWNIHASLLPRWRGAAPIQRAILAGDEQTGVCIMQMEAGLDTGPVLLSEALSIGGDETAGELHDRLADLGARLLLQAIAQPDELVPQPQPAQGVTYADKLSKAEAALDWSKPAVELARQVRAFNPWPVATAQLRSGDQPLALRVWQAQAWPGAAPPGLVRRANANGIEVGTGDGVLRLTVVQKPGGKAMPVAQFLNATRIDVGSPVVG